MPNVKFCENISEFKILILGFGKIIGREAADKLLEILARDGKEALTYQYNELENHFVACDQVWLEVPGRVLPDITGYGTGGK